MVEHNEHIAGQATSSFLPSASADATLTPTTREAFKIAETMPNEEGPEITHSSVHSGDGEDSAEEMDTGDLASRSGDYFSDEEDGARFDQRPSEPTSVYTNFGGDQTNTSTSPQLATAFQNDWPSGSDVASAAPNLPGIDLISEFHDDNEDNESSSTSELADERTVITINPVASLPATSVGPNENHSATPLDASVALHPVESLPNDFYDPEASSLGDHAIEDPLFAGIRFTRDDGSLINAFDLHSFIYDQLLPTMFLGAPDTNDRRDDPYNAHDAERFYVSDDEFCVEGPDASKATEFRTPGQTGAEVSDEPLPNGHAARQPDTPPPPATTFSTDHPPPFDPNYPQVNDSNETDGEANDHAGGGGPVMHTESMKPSFLTTSSAASVSTVTQSQKTAKGFYPPDDRLSHLPNMQGALFHPRKLASSFATQFSILIETRIYAILVRARRLGSDFVPGVLHADIFVNQPIISFLSGPRALHGFPVTSSQCREFFQDAISWHYSSCAESARGDFALLADTQTSQPRLSESPCSPQSELRIRTRTFSPSARNPRPLLSDDEYYHIHAASIPSPYFIHPMLILRIFNDHTHVASSLLATPLAPPDGDFYGDANGIQYPAFERNLSIDQFIRQWFLRSRTHVPRICGAKRPITIPISSEAAHVLDWERPSKISRPEPSKIYDIQGIPWSTRLKVKRSDARRQRDQMYSCYHNLKYVPRTYSNVLPQSEDYFRPKTMYTKYRASMAHFQLRNLMSVTASNTLQYAYQSKIYSVTPFHNEQNCLINLSDPTTSRNFLDSVKISTMKTKYGVTLAGGFSGEYAYRGQISDSITMDGRVTKDPNGITNHIDVIQNRTNHSPQAVISSNDDRIRILDCATNKFINTHRFARAINCTDTSPDGRLRVIVGDAPDAWVVDSDNGKPIQVLSSHRDYGFACAWSPDMLHVATSNQDKTVNIWDARMWRILQIIESDVAGYRSLRFSPVGGGPRTLLMCEPADRIVLVNAQSYQTRQVHDFFGEIGGADFSPDGSRIWVANMDAKFGGFMEFDRREWGQQFGIGHTKRRRIENAGDFYYPDLPNEWLPEDRLDDDPRCVLGSRERKLRFQKLFTDTQFEMLDPYLG
ncbi:hypothetical protein LOZ58_001491 [Ophidiomyces ophidiicola]|nr:hypothetical protein LOZ58_001491 [Ophidiomyces ophidiicola]